MPTSLLDTEMMRLALSQAEKSIGLSDPNPRVGCVIGTADGRVLGVGHTQRAGQAHAEVQALRDAASKQADVRGATAWVTLEPCAHHGRTPPCCDALVDAGIGRVVIAIEDPFPAVAGRGRARLLAAGIEVTDADSDLAALARDLNVGFFSRFERGRPWVRAKIAASLDGRTGLVDGTSKWITGPLARADTHFWRKRAGAVMTGIGTVLADNPRLDVREVETALQPLRIVVDSTLRTPPTSRILQPPGACLIACCNTEQGKEAELRAHGARVEAFGAAASAPKRVNLAALLSQLASDGINELHVEAGATLNGRLLSDDAVDELLIYLAPKLLGPGRPMADLPALKALPEGHQFQFVDVTTIGPDLRLRATKTKGLSSR